MPRPLSREEIESMLAGEKPGVIKEVVRKVLQNIHKQEDAESAILTVALLPTTDETKKMVIKGIELVWRK
jgi:hypothetical protein